MIAGIISKFVAPTAIGIAIGVAGMIGIQKATKPEIKLECPVIDYSKFPKCPECPATLGNEFEKVKGKNITLNLTQHMKVVANGDSLIAKRIIDEMVIELNKLKLARCK